MPEQSSGYALYSAAALVGEIDSSVFIVSENSSEIYGKGFGSVGL